jgi:cell division transport system permease protein
MVRPKSYLEFLDRISNSRQRDHQRPEVPRSHPRQRQSCGGRTERQVCAIIYLMTDGITFKRILKWGFINFFRSGVVSAATVLVMSLSILTIGSVIVASSFASALITILEEKVDISAYFKTDASETAIFVLKGELEKLEDVKSVKYISRDDALAVFQERHKDDNVIMGSLDIVGENPFSASLEISAINPAKYESISQFLETGGYDNILAEDELGVKKITYRQNQLTIDRLTSLISLSRRVGFTLSFALAVIALIVAYSTVKLAIYNAKDEIAVMQLVGASRSFIRGPFLVEGIIHGVLAALFTLAVFYPVFWYSGEKTKALFGGLNIFEYFQSNIFQIIAILFATGIILGMLSAMFAIRRYLKV